jgi:predicted MFS family arabinose efflux permease
VSRIASRTDASEASHTWIVAGGLSLAAAVSLGLARFAYALLLPGMRSSLHWSYAQAGAINTANSVGYLVGAASTASIGSRCGQTRTFAVALGTVGASLLAVAIAPNYVTLLALRAIAGGAGAVAFVVGAGLAAVWAAQRTAAPPAVLGIYTAGAGIGILVSAAAISPLLSQPSHWRIGWALLGALATLAVVPARAAARRVSAQRPRTGGGHRVTHQVLVPLRATLTAYALFGAGYIAYMTFIVALLRHQGATNTDIIIFWTLLGSASIASTVIWRHLLARLAGGAGTAATIAVVALGAALPLASGSRASAFGSALLFGGAFMSVVTAVTTHAQRLLPPDRWLTAIGALTTAFALGQTAGPLGTGFLADTVGIEGGLAASTAILAIAASIAIRQRPPGGQTTLSDFSKRVRGNAESST